MKKITLTLASAAVLLALPAMAADLRVVKAPPPPPMPIYHWTGFYLGVNVGYSVARNRGNETLFDIANSEVETNQQVTLGPAGAVGGFQGGYNYQFANSWLIGIEADWQWTGQKDSICVTICRPDVFLTIEQKLRWLATLRARLGYAQAGWLWYVTGGAAWGGVEENDAFFLAGGGVVPGAGPFVGTLNVKHTRSGWTFGGGVETLLFANWSAKLEYLYVDLGTTTDTFAVIDTSNGAVAASQTVSKPMRDHILRVGLNYRLGDWFGKAPVAARY
jgi:outer membrane immunogenic protein